LRRLSEGEGPNRNSATFHSNFQLMMRDSQFKSYFTSDFSRDEPVSAATIAKLWECGGRVFQIEAASREAGDRVAIRFARVRRGRRFRLVDSCLAEIAPAAKNRAKTVVR
jgi:hypothetical protein